MRSSTLAVGVSVLAVGWLAGGSSGLADAPPPAQYVSLGDSLAASMQPNAGGNDQPTSQGFSEGIWRDLSPHYSPSLELVKLGRGGETAASMIKAKKPGPSQLQLAEKHVRTGTTALVTIDIGANEVEGCGTGTGFDRPCVERGLASLRESLPKIISGLRAAGGENLRIVGINYYNSFLGRWVTGANGRRLARASIPIERAINDTLEQIYDRFDIPIADVETSFRTDAVDQYVTTARFGRVPLAVANTCRWTWACSSRYDDHTNAAGYRVITNSVLARLRRP